MESYIPISKINDFLFCPKTLYLHMLYENFFEDLFHGEAQKRGKIRHQSIENKNYSTEKKFIIGKEIYSEKYKLMGKIDIYNTKEKILIERKTKIKKIYDGYKYQIYAQYFCLKEMGYEVLKLQLYSLSDNKKYDIPLPDKKEIEKFEELLSKIWNFNPSDLINHNCSRCQNSIYKFLNW